MRLISAAEERDLRDELARLRALNDSLFQTVLSLKATGAVVEREVTPLARREPDRVTEVVADVAGNNGALRRALNTFARNARRDGLDEDEIVQKLLHWGTDDEGTPE